MSEKMNVLFLGSFYPQKLYKTVKEDSKGKVGFSNHNFEMSIIHGLLKQPDINLKIVSSPSVYSYPYNNNKVYTASEHYSIDGVPVFSIGFSNLPVINKINKIWSLVSCLIRTFNSYDGDQIKVILNTPNVYSEIALSIVQRLVKKHIDTTLIIPDIPSFVSSMDKMNGIKSLLIKWLDSYSMKLAERFNHYVLLTEAMKELFHKQLDYIVMEGIVDVESMQVNSGGGRVSDCRKKIILYTGTLRKIFGVMNLVEAFDAPGFEDTELWICGSGESADEIKERASKNPSIKFWGLVDSSTALEMQQKATVLVNPRTSEGEFTKYSFPSKTMEYLLSGNAVLINKLPGIPNEYYQYVYTTKDERIESLREALLNIINLGNDVRNDFAQRGQEFILNNKNSKVQTRRILDLIRIKHENICNYSNI